MSRLFLTLLCLCFGLFSYSQYVFTHTVYPIVNQIPKAVFEQFDRQLVSDCATGNCKDGNGVWVEVIAEGYCLTANDPAYARNANIMIRITRGKFSEGGKICEGEQTFTYVPLSRAGQNENYRPVTAGQRLDTTTADHRLGVFTKSYWGYYTNEEVELTAMARRFGYKKVNVVTRNGEINYARVEYGNTDSIRSFSGIVDERLRPVYGVAHMRNGSVINGFFVKNRPGPGYFFKNATALKGEPRDDIEQLDFLPGQKLLRDLFTQKEAQGYFQPSLGWGSQEQENDAGLPAIALSRGLDLYGNGWLIGDDGLSKPKDYTGKGIYFYNSRQFYFGSFLRGMPEGSGSFYKRHIGGAWIDVSRAPVFLKTGLYTQGVFTEGHFVYEEAGAYYSKKLSLRSISEPLFPELAKAANLNDPNALFDLGEKYLTGNGVGRNMETAIRYFDRALLFGNIRAASRLGALYANGNPALSIAKDDEKAMKYYLKGAQLLESKLAGKQEIEDCKQKYFLLKYPFLTAAQASGFALEDEYNFLSELTALWQADNRKRKLSENGNATGQTRTYTAEEANGLIGKMFFGTVSERTSKNGWSVYTRFYKVSYIEGEMAHASTSTTLYPLVEHITRPYSWFLNTRYNGLTEAKKNYSSCQACSGTGKTEGYTTSKYTSDYEYTLGVKITTTTTQKTLEQCRKCYGAGFCPTDGSLPEW